jgi:phosphate transport system substrate-binding protein
MTKTVRSLMILIVIMSFLLAACGGAATATQAPTQAPAPTEVMPEPTATEAAAEPTAAPTEDAMAMYAPDAATGDFVAAGSSTVFPLYERMKQRFEEEGFTGNNTYDSIGTGGGFERFCKTGETDISGASRAIKDTEAESCAAINREPLEFRVGTDAIAVVVSKENDFLTDVTKEELAAIFSTAKQWSDVRPDWPAEDILRYVPGTDSGTFDYFVEAIMAPANPDADGNASVENGEKAFLEASNLNQSEDDNVLVQGVEGSPNAVGFFGFAYYSENSDKLNVLSVGGVTPDEKTAEDNSYPISRPLFIYSTAQIMQDKPQVASFIHFFLTEVNNEIDSVGYFPASQEALDAALATWSTAVGMK